MRCLQCGNINLEPSLLCQVCGAALREDSAGATGGQAEEAPLTALLYQAAIGPVHAEHYLRQFARFDASGRVGLSWHWPAFFATLAWLVFRRMWGYALGYALLSLSAALLLFGGATLLFQASQQEQWTLLAALLTAEFLLPALYANALYHRECNRRMAKALAAAPDIAQTCLLLQTDASSARRGWIVGAVALLAWLAAAAGFWLALTPEPSPAAKVPARSLSASVGRANASEPAASAAIAVMASAAGTSAASAPAASAPASAATAASAASATSVASAASAASAAAPAASAPAQASSSPAPAAPAASAARAAAPATTASAPAKPAASGTVAAASAPAAPRPIGVAPVAAAAAASAVPVAPVTAAASIPAAATTSASASAAAPRVRKEPRRKASSAGAADAHYLVAVGLFAREENASNAFEKLQAAGLPVYSDTLKIDAGTRYRVRVGPFDSLQQARNAAQRIEKLELPAVVMKR